MSSVDLTASVIVCTYDLGRFALLARAVDAVRAQLRPGDELVVVVDNSRTLTQWCRHAWPELQVQENDLGRGLSSARTVGVKHSAGEVIVFLDDDAVPADGWLEAMKRPFLDPKVVGVSGATLPAWEGGRPAWFPDEFGWVVGCDYRGLPGDGKQVRNPIGANMAFRADALHAAGGFNSELGRVGADLSGCEETEIAIRIRERSDGVIVRQLGAEVSHHVPAERATWRHFVSRCWREGRSKATLSGLVGADTALASERRHLLRTLPQGMLRAGPLGAFAILLGTAATVLGYLAGRSSAQSQAARPALPPGPSSDIEDGTFSPVEVHHLDLDDASCRAPRPNRDGDIAILAVDRGWPVGFARLHRLDETVDLRARVRSELGSAAVAPDHWPSRWPQDDTETLLSVVVATLGRRPQLRSVIAALLEQTYHRIEVIVVDNDPVSGNATAVAREFDDARLRIVREPRRGTSAARNAGIAIATGDIIAFTDDDAVPAPTWVENLARTFRAGQPYGRSRLAALTGLVVPYGFATAAQVAFEGAAGFGRGFQCRYWTVHPQLDPLQGRAVRGPEGIAFPYTGTEFGSGNNMAIRRDVLERFGGFDERLGPGTPTEGGEDLDLLRRLYLAGETIVYCPHAVVAHHHRASEDELVGQMRGYGVGMGAILTKLVITQPVHAFGLALRIPPSLRELLSPDSTKNRERGSDYPMAAARAEFRGYLVGPWRYLRSGLKRVL